jgi:zinc transport system substrate-binding protein
VIGGSFARVGVLDPIAADIPPGAEAYPTLLSQMASSLRDCLGA